MFGLQVPHVNFIAVTSDTSEGEEEKGEEQGAEN
jgi:hypothetical protein